MSHISEIEAKVRQALRAWETSPLLPSEMANKIVKLVLFDQRAIEAISELHASQAKPLTLNALLDEIERCGNEAENKTATPDSASAQTTQSPVWVELLSVPIDALVQRGREFIASQLSDRH